MVILVTGGTGFLGEVHVRNLIEKHGIDPKDIRVLARNSKKITDLNDVGVEFFNGNLQDFNTLEGIMTDVTDVYHIAAIVINESVSREVMMKVNYLATINLAEKFLKEESTRKFVFASSIGAYGFKWPKFPLTEDYPKKPANNYQESKLLAEEYLQKINQENGLNFSALRNPLILGLGDKVTSLRLSQGLLDGKIVYIGKGNNKLSFIDGRDSSDAMILTSKKKESSGQSYNIKSFDLTQNDYFRLYGEALGNYVPKKRYPAWLVYLFALYKELTTPKGQEVLITRTRVDRYSNTRLIDTSKIEKELGFKPSYSNPEKSIKDSVDWLVDKGYLEIPAEKLT